MWTTVSMTTWSLIVEEPDVINPKDEIYMDASK